MIAAPRLFAALLLVCVVGCREQVSPVFGAGTGAAGHSGAAGRALVDAGGLDAATSGAGAAGGAAGGGGEGGAAGMVAGAGGHVCIIPDNLALEPDDLDGGVDPSCFNVPRMVIANNCIGGICHHSGKRPAALLDLMSPCVADRLLTARSTICNDRPLLDPKHLDARGSFLIDKLDSTKPECGESMPFGGHLPRDEAHCMAAWINAVGRVAR